MENGQTIEILYHFNEFKYINFTSNFRVGLRGAMVARLTPDQKAACSSHVGVTEDFFFIIIFFLLRKYQFSFGLTKNRFSLLSLS